MTSAALSTRRLLAALALAALASALLVVGPLSPSASATTVTVSNETEYRDALTTLSSDSDGPHTITLTGSFSITQDGVPVYDGDESLTIDGGGHTVSYAPELGNESSFLLFTPTFVSLYAATAELTLTGITVEGFDDLGAVEVVTDGDITIANSHFNDNYRAGLDGYGGAIMTTSGDGTVYVTDSTFTGNSAGSDSGAIDVGGDAYVTDSVFTNNHSDGLGGAIYVDDDLHVSGSDFVDNTSVDYGGAVYGDSDAFISESTFTGNSSQDHGGALYVYENLEVTDSTFTGNESDYDGGAVYVYDGDVDIHGSTFSDNDAVESGGAVFAYAYADIVESEFVNNSAGDDGGAAYVDYDSYVAASTFSGNSADRGGALFSFHVAYIDVSTFTGNVAAASGGAVYLRDDIEVSHSTFAGNEAGNGGAHIATDYDMYADSTAFANAIGVDGCEVDAVTDGYNFDDDGTCSESIAETDGDFGFGMDAQLGALADNGGPTRTMLPAADSPLVNAIPTVDCTTGADQRGVDRPAGDGCDVGAVEVLGPIDFVIPTADGDINATVWNAQCVQDVEWEPTGAYSAPPAGLSTPFGVSSFTFCVPEAGWTVDIELDLPRPVTSLWKVTESGGWSEITSASFADTVVSYSVTEGGALDESTDTNYIVDPVAPGVLAGFTG